MTVNEEMNAEELAKRNAQERVTKPLHPEDVPLFIRESVEVGCRHLAAVTAKVGITQVVCYDQ